MSDNNYSNTGTSLTTLLTVAFVVLKLCGVITWSWFWVLSPSILVWGIIALMLLVTLVVRFLFARRFEKEEKEIKSRWQQRMDEVQQRLKERKKRSAENE